MQNPSGQEARDNVPHQNPCWKEDVIMAITRHRNRAWPTSLRDFDQVADHFNRLFGDQFLASENAGWVPRVNVEETNDHLVLTAELPGLQREDVEIEVENNVLTLRGRKEETREQKEEPRYHVWERQYGTFQRSFSLPRTVSSDKIGATFENGVLRVEMPKAAEAKGRKIEIRTEG
jgi:HSP20 family protein